MKVALSTLLADARLKFLAFRRMERFLNSDIFEKAYSKANDYQANEMIQLVKELDLETLKGYCKDIAEVELSKKPVMELRRMAQSFKIKHYALLDKQTLIEKIEEHYAAYEETRRQEA